MKYFFGFFGLGWVGLFGPVNSGDGVAKKKKKKKEGRGADLRWLRDGAASNC
jgi:hypothetical protein